MVRCETRRGCKSVGAACATPFFARAGIFIAVALAFAAAIRRSGRKKNRGTTVDVRSSIGSNSFSLKLRTSMKIQRREFLKTSLAASATAALASRVDAATPKASTASGREYYELRAYRLKPGKSQSGLDEYLGQALLPALAQRGIKNCGAFTELEVNKAAGTSAAKADTPVWVLIPHTSLDSFVNVAADLNRDPAVQKAGGEYLQAKKSDPAFDRIDSWLLLAFEGMPKLQLPAFSKNKIPTRIFEMRDYESHSELKALSKMAMFNEGEIEIMKDLGMSPVFFGQALAGPNLPHLRYITCAADLATHLANWKKFSPDPRWVKMKDLPQYLENTSKNTARFLTPKPYSQI
jgi:hypothetical protein